MKLKDVTVPGEYLTKVSGTMVRVRVTAKIDHPAVHSRQGFGDIIVRASTSFRCERVDNGKRLTNRTAGKLHSIPTTAKLTVNSEASMADLHARMKAMSEENDGAEIEFLADDEPQLRVVS